MEKTTFEIMENEIKKVAGRKLSKKQIQEIMTAIENDSVLWNDIEKSVRDAIRQVVK